MTESPFGDSAFAVLVFSPRDDLIACLNKAMDFLTTIASLRGDKGKIIWVLLIRAMLLVKGEILQVDRQELLDATTAKVKDIWLGNALSLSDQGMQHEVPNSETYLNDMDNQSVHALKNFEQSPVMDFRDNEISTDLERYKERVKTFEQRLNIDLSSREKMIDSQMDDMIREKLALKEQIDSLEQNLSKQIKEKESLFKTFTVFKNESKEKENKYLENEIDLEKEIKELDNIVCKVGQSAQTVHMLTKPQAFYDNTHKQALGYQNLFYLKKAQRIKPTLYDGAVMSKTHVAMPVIDDEETLILEEESRSKMFEKAKDPEVIAKKISHKPIDYEKLNSLTDDFGKRFSPQQELSAEQAFWFHTLNPTIEPSYTPPVIVDVPSELPKVSLVNASLKKLKFHLTQFDSVVKKRTTPSALEEGEWGFEHTKTIFNNEIIPFLKSLKDIFNVFDKDLLNEITEVQSVFDQIEASVQQFSVDKKCLEIAKKEILLENDRLLQKIMSQDVLITVMNSMSLNNNSVNMEMLKCDSCEKCLNLDAELSKSKQAYNDLLKNHSQLEQHCISLEVSMQLKQELQDKDKTICKLKDTSKSLRENTKKENVNHDKWEFEPINKELENSVAKLLSKNERLCNEINHVKQVFKDQFDSIKKTRVRHKEQSDSLINKLNLKFVENEDLKAQIQDKEIVKQAKVKQPLDNELDLACKYATRIQELLVYVQDTCPNAIIPSAKKVTVKPMNNVKKVRNKKNKVEARPRKVNKVNRVIKPVCDVDVKHSLSKANSEILCVTCNKSMFDGVHDKCLLDLVQNGFKWKPTGRIFTIVGNSCPLTRFTSTNVVQIILWYLDSGCSKHMTGNRSQLMNFVSKILGTLRTENDQIARIMGYGDYQLGNVIISMFRTRASKDDPATSSIGLGSNPVSQQPCLPPIRDDWDRLFQPMFDEYFNPPTIVVSPVSEAAAPRAEVLADSPVSISINQDAPSTSIPSSQEQEHSPIISQGFEESPKTPTFHDDPLNESPNEDSTSQGSSSNIRQIHTPFEHLGRWTKDHPIANVIGDPSRSVSTRKQLETDAMWCYFDAFLTSVEPKNFKQAMTEPSWIDAMQEEIHEFERLEV
ncbi:hypothetical protein Tco_0974155 [Tanacetum coccineum]|uniref:Retrovirus-related Pol polyprotein from transposon TNT 1-94-like beta-barrel domain-containing protein n=1 Tax=Tanacetum coccineum TaxID=301880 RepID=A0ABQ5EAV7_9ASTR